MQSMLEFKFCNCTEKFSVKTQPFIPLCPFIYGLMLVVIVMSSYNVQHKDVSHRLFEGLWLVDEIGYEGSRGHVGLRHVS